MRMFGAIFRFELRYHLTRPITWLYFVLFLAGAFAFTSTDTIAIAGGSGLVMRNAPVVIVRTMLLIVVLGQIVVSGLVGSSMLRDYQYRTHELVFTTPISRFAYLGGRFLGAFTVMVVVHAGMVVGMVAGNAMPWLDQARLLPLDLASYIVPFVTLVVPAVLVISAIFMAVGALTRSAFAIHTQGIVLLIGWSIAQSLIGKIDSKTIAALLDPVGLTALGLTTRYWSVAEQNTRAVTLGGVLLANRLLWTVAGLALAGLTVVLFRFRSAPPSMGRTRPLVEEAAPRVTGGKAPSLSVATQTVGWRPWWVQFASTMRMSVLSIVRQLPFAVIVVVGLINLGIAATYAEVVFGQRAWPVTYTVVEVINAQFALFFMVLIALFAGELVWRERELNTDQIVDALPGQTSATMLGKVVGLLAVEASLLALLAVTGMLYQLASGYTHLEPWLYVTYLYGTVFPTLMQLTALAVLIHVLANQKYLGHALVIFAYTLRKLAPTMGLEHPLVRYAESGPLRYSDMNGYGPYVPGLFWTALYWTAVAVLFCVVAYLVWVRGTEPSWAVRRRAAGQRWRGATKGVAFGALGAGAVAFGVLFNNANRVNHWKGSTTIRHEKAAYEKTYKPLERLPQPRLIAADVRADLVPERLSFGVSGTFTFVNHHAAPIDSLLVVILSRDVQVDTLAWGRPARTLVDDADQNVRLYRLDTPLAPNDTLTLRYRGHYDWRGFPAGGPDTTAVSIGTRNAISANGSFVSYEYFPFLGYLSWRELESDNARRKEGLASRVRAPRLEDESARDKTYLGISADWIRFHATVSTAPDQVGIAPGELVREYRENGRRVFEYQAPEKMLAFYTFLSGRYAVKHDTWNGIPLDIYYHQGHEFNLDRMTASMRTAMQDYSTRYSPFQFRQFRIVEFPRYSQFAQAYPATIPFSENIGFILRAGTSADDIDTPFYVTAHELAHQWWFHQVVGANVQGATMLSESLANYSAILVMEKTFGAGNIRKFLRQQLDQYLAGRGRESKAERPLMRVENQMYIHYNKGSLAFYALRDLIGDAAMNRALSHFVTEKGMRGAPFPTSADLMGYLQAETPDSLRYALDDLFRTITLWDNEAKDGTVTKRADGRYDVAITLRASKLRADSLGNERPIPMADYVDIGVFGGPDSTSSLGKPLYLAKHRLGAGDTTLHVTVREAPKSVGVDPFNKLIDRDPKDNVVTVKSP